MHELTMHELTMHELTMHELTIHELTIHELTIHELDAQLAEQLPARELMGRLGRLTNLIHIITATSVVQGSTATAANNSILIGSGNTFVISLQIVL